jgi:nitroimidazol reductase NimA-like FMN-containing flavoprotein (pyridoxamine 5'-phosphate oxidase superfamily)
VVARGTLAIVDDREEMRHAMDVLIHHHEREPEPIRLRFLSEGTWATRVTMLRLDITEWTGKGNC